MRFGVERLEFRISGLVIGVPDLRWRVYVCGKADGDGVGGA